MKQIENPKARLAILLVYMGALIVANWIAFGQWRPHTDGRSLWLAAGLFSLLLSSFLVTPYFERPANYIASAAASFVAVWFVIDWDKFTSLEQFLSVVLLVYLGCVAIAAGTAVFLQRQRTSKTHKRATVSKLIADTVGQDRLLYSIVIIFAVILFHRDSAREILTILITLIVIVLVRPELSIANLYSRIRLLLADKEITGIAGTIAGFDEPGIVLVRQKDRSLKFGQFLLINDGGTRPQAAQVLGYFGRDEGLLLRAKLLDVGSEQDASLELLARNLQFGDVAVLKPTGELEASINKEVIAARADSLTGIVAANSALNSLKVEIIQDRDLFEGSVLEATIRGRSVLYQLTNGLTHEEIVFQKNNRGFAVAEARKIGEWDNSRSKIVTARWLPEMFSPVFRIEQSQDELPLEAVGRLPGTNYPASISSIQQLVTHNTAILGILGVGKSYLALELVERMFAEGVKVICLDLTNQYASELSDFYDSPSEEKILNNLRTLGASGKTRVSKNVEEGGSRKQFAEAILKDLRTFLDPANPAKLKIYNPAEFEVWRQDSKPYANEASMASLTPPEIAQIVSEATIEIASGMGMTDEARVCIIYEEAHSLVPEWNSVVADGDKSASNGTARAILQGRKYGMGCLLITQRTANVTKSILNQCNTIFAFRTFDDTGKAFLENYLGSQYSTVLPSLEERHVVFFGKASSCENPVLIRVNDRPDFTERFRAKYPPTKPAPPAPAAPELPDAAPEDDDIPF